MKIVKISEELWLESLKRWDKNNPTRGYYPSCGYCLAADECQECYLNSVAACGENSIWTEIQRIRRKLERSFHPDERLLLTEEITSLMDKLYDIILEHGRILKYIKEKEIPVFDF